MSMEDNNTSAFNCRATTGKPNEFSLHAYGVAIDINPLQNPYIGFSKENIGEAFVLPKTATPYVNRIVHAPGSAESIVDIFAAHGFSEWGGHWVDRIDYQHFQVPRAKAELLAKRQKTGSDRVSHCNCIVEHCIVMQCSYKHCITMQLWYAGLIIQWRDINYVR